MAKQRYEPWHDGELQGIREGASAEGGTPKPDIYDTTLPGPTRVVTRP
jgi:hypothetical protein